LFWFFAREAVLYSASAFVRDIEGELLRYGANVVASKKDAAPLRPAAITVAGPSRVCISNEIIIASIAIVVAFAVVYTVALRYRRTFSAVVMAGE
jgi:hypothetical protein